jgi:Kelch motif
VQRTAGSVPGRRPSRLAVRAGLLAAAAVASALLAPQAAIAAGSGSFIPAASMGAARYHPAAAPLPDGRVLVAGGYYYDGGGDHFLQGAEAFNPATNAWTAVASMDTARLAAAAAPLPDGRVLVAGGFNGSIELSSVEAYNPATNTWALVAPMGTAREGAAAARLPDGRVLVAGGHDGFSPLASAEAYNPATNTWAPVASMGTARYYPAAAPLPDGGVLVAGGTSGPYLSSAEAYNPATNNWGTLASLGTARFDVAASPLPDGRVLVAGGYYFDGAGHHLRSAEAYDPATNAFNSAGIGAMSTPRKGPAAAPLPDGRVLVAGGVNDATIHSSAEVFAATNAFSFRVKGRRLIVSVQALGKVSVSDAASPLAASAKRRKRRVLLKPSSAAGDPPRITVPLRLSRLAKQRLRRKGKVKARARITFAPLGGLANTQRAKLKIKGRVNRAATW